MSERVKNTCLIFLLYAIGVLAYLSIIHLFSIPVHLGVDEELYISMARSFHYEGVFAQNGRILDYSCVLYSIIISLAYYFYSPENIIYLFRAIGVITMLSSVFPIYIMGKRILSDNKKALFLSAFSLILPSMMDVAYCMQEVLAYPLFLWVIYFIFREIDNNKLFKASKGDIVIAVLSVLCYFTKTYMIFIPLVYCAFCVLDTLMHQRGYLKSSIKKICIFGILLLILYCIGKYAVLLINDGEKGINHYSSQFSHLFPITLNTMICTISCCIVYVVTLLFTWGILPIILPLYNIKKLDEKNKKYILFVVISICVLIVEIVISIVLTEEGNVIAPAKICYRYFQIFEIPIILLFINNIKKYNISKLWGIYTFVLGILVAYFIYINGKQHHAIIDAPLFLLMENITRYIIPYFNVLACVMVIILLLIVYFYNKRKKQNILKLFINFSVLCVMLFFIINLFQLPYYTNKIANGSEIEQDAIKIAYYLDEGNYNIVYFVKSEKDRYERAVYAYMNKPIIYVESIEDVKNDAIIIMSSQNNVDAMNGYEKIELNTNLNSIFTIYAK